MNAIVTRRAALAGGGALLVTFSLSGARAQTETGKGGRSKRGLAGSLDDTPRLDSCDSN